MPETPQPSQSDSEPLESAEKKPSIYFGSTFSLPYPTPESPARKVKLIGRGTGEDENKLAIKPNPQEELYDLIDPDYVIEHGSDFWPYEKLPPDEVERQYNQQVEHLRRNNILATKYGKEGIIGEETNDNGDETEVFYPLPTIEQVIEQFQEQQEELMPKVEQGITLPLLVPFGVRTTDLQIKVGECIKRHKQDKKLFATKLSPSDPDVELDLDQTQPVYLWDQNSDTEAVYYPQALTAENHGGQSKQQVIASQKVPGWQLLLLEDLPNLPRDGNTQTIGDRQQLDNTGEAIKKYISDPSNPQQKTPSIAEFFQAVKTEQQYHNEIGLTYESWLSYFLYHLEETDQVIDDYQGNGKVSYLTGQFFPSEPNVSFACWYCVNSQASLGRNHPSYRGSDCAPRLAVKVS